MNLFSLIGGSGHEPQFRFLNAAQDSNVDVGLDADDNFVIEQNGHDALVIFPDRLVLLPGDLQAKSSTFTYRMTGTFATVGPQTSAIPNTEFLGGFINRTGKGLLLRFAEVDALNNATATITDIGQDGAGNFSIYANNVKQCHLEGDGLVRQHGLTRQGSETRTSKLSGTGILHRRILTQQKSADQTIVQLQRAPGDYLWVGFVTIAVNQ